MRFSTQSIDGFIVLPVSSLSLFYQCIWFLFSWLISSKDVGFTNIILSCIFRAVMIWNMIWNFALISGLRLEMLVCFLVEMQDAEELLSSYSR